MYVFVCVCDCRGCAGARAQAYRFAAGGPVIRCTIYFSVIKTYKVYKVSAVSERWRPTLGASAMAVSRGPRVPVCRLVDMFVRGEG